MLSETQLREQVAQFVGGQISRDEFEDWLVQNSWNIHRGRDIAAQRLVYAVELRLAENDSGHLPELEFRAELKSLLNNVNFPASPDDPIITSGSCNVTVRSPWEAVNVDMRYATASWSPTRH